MLELNFLREKETKNTVRFKEVKRKTNLEVIGILYVKKQALTELGNPNTLKVTLSSGEVD